MHPPNSAIWSSSTTTDWITRPEWTLNTRGVVKDVFRTCPLKTFDASPIRRREHDAVIFVAESHGDDDAYPAEIVDWSSARMSIERSSFHCQITRAFAVRGYWVPFQRTKDGSNTLQVVSLLRMISIVRHAEPVLWVHLNAFPSSLRLHSSGYLSEPLLPLPNPKWSCVFQIRVHPCPLLMRG